MTTHIIAIRMTMESLGDLTPTLCLLLKSLRNLGLKKVEDPDMFIQRWRNRFLMANRNVGFCFGSGDLPSDSSSDKKE